MAAMIISSELWLTATELRRLGYVFPELTTQLDQAALKNTSMRYEDLDINFPRTSAIDCAGSSHRRVRCLSYGSRLALSIDT